MEQMEASSGKQSTEFMALVLLAAVIVVNGTAYVDIDSTTLNTFIAAVVAYIGQRGWVKASTAKANAEIAKASSPTSSTSPTSATALIR